VASSRSFLIGQSNISITNPLPKLRITHSIKLLLPHPDSRPAAFACTVTSPTPH
jgi:hypothetical protein